jgi:hypothetical protein
MIIPNVQYIRGADSDTDHYLVVEKVRKTLTLGNKAARECDVERFNLKLLSELEVIMLIILLIGQKCTYYEEKHRRFSSCWTGVWTRNNC